MRVLLVATALSFMSSLAVASPSFDCSKAKSADEIAICGDPELAQNDRETSRLFEIAKSKDRSKALSIARDFLSRRKICGSSAPCIRQAQQDAINTFQQTERENFYGVPLFDPVPTNSNAAPDNRLSRMIADIIKRCNKTNTKSKQRDECQKQQGSSAREYIDIADNIIYSTEKSASMKQCLSRWPSEDATDWKAVVDCFKSRVDADNRAALIAEQEAAKRKIEEDKKALEQRRIEEEKRAEEQKAAEEEARRQAEIRRAEQQKRDEEAKIAAEKLQAEVADIEKPQPCTEPSDSDLERIRDNFEIELFDARSARFNSSCTYNTDGKNQSTFICGLLNSKNTMGAYVGYHPFYAALNNPAEKSVITEKKDDFISKLHLKYHCYYCTNSRRTFEACEAAIAQDKYDPMSDAIRRRSEQTP